MAKRKLRQRPKSITLTLPAQQLPTILARTSTVTKTSARHELKIVSTLLQAGDADINNVSLSKSTIHRQRKSTITSDAAKMRERLKKFEFSEEQTKFLVLHWDGKIIQYITGDTEERLAIAVSAPNFIPGQFIASPAMADGKGLTMSNCVYQVAEEYDFSSQVKAMVFDSTASYTRVWKGSNSRFEKRMKRKLLCLACRHHIPDIHHIPDTDPLFKNFKKVFGSINFEERTL